MNPVIQRELIEQCRTPALFRLRLVSVIGVVVALVWGLITWEEMRRSGGMMFGPWGVMRSEGGFLFSRVQMTLMLILLALAPTLTADAIARERREATLGLLGLTPLRPGAIAVGKSAANALRALTLWLAAVPVLTVPSLMGGVTVRQMAEAVVAQFAGLMIGLAAGLVASSLSQQFRRALALAFAIEVALVGVVLVLQFGLLLAVGMLGQFVMHPASAPIIPFDRAIGLLPRAMTGDFAEAPRMPGGVTAMGEWLGWLIGLASLLLAAAAVIWAAIRSAAWRIAHAWQEQPPRPAAVELQRQLTRPILFPGWIRRQQRARLSRNPLVWIQHRTVTSALTRWGWIFVVMVTWMLIAATGGWMGGFPGRFSMPMWAGPLVLLSGMAFSAAGGFRAERENGTLELLLVTPLHVNQILQSRWSAHLREFLLPVALQLSLAIYVQGLWHRSGVDYSRFNWILIASLVGIPAIGLWRGLKARHFVTAVLSTLFWALLVPLAGSMVVSALLQPAYFLTPAQMGGEGWSFFWATRLDWGVLPAVIQLLVAGLGLWIARRELVSRRFVHQVQTQGRD
jgi:ABC-type transport system involved in cytochrome c biogenesis permease component